jgi:hypothetical protein
MCKFVCIFYVKVLTNIFNLKFSLFTILCYVVLYCDYVNLLESLELQSVCVGSCCITLYSELECLCVVPCATVYIEFYFVSGWDDGGREVGGRKGVVVGGLNIDFLGMVVH